MVRSLSREDAGKTDEADPLIAAPVRPNHHPEAALVHGDTHRKATPLPLLQLLILGAVRLAEPIAFSQVSLKVFWLS
jgi:hypothetical protein